MYKAKDIIYSLEAMGAPRDSVVMFHSSLRAIGEVEGGGEGLFNVLIDYFTSDGGLFCVPVHTWSNFGKNRPTLDMTAAETNLGAFPLIAAMDKRGVRSLNPTHSVVVFGSKEKAEEFIKDDETITNPICPKSCYGKISDRKGYVLLAGVSHSRNTFLHTAEEMAGIPGRMVKENTPVTVRMPSGEIITRDWYMFDESVVGDVSLRFPKYETAFRYHRCIKDGYIGDAPAQLCDAFGMKEVVRLIFENSGADPMADERPIPPKSYCGPKICKLRRD